jgi:hypothetical protein
MRQYLDQRVSPLVVEQAFPGTQAANKVAGAARHVSHLVSCLMEDSRLSMLAWHDMLMAAVWIVNRRPSVTVSGECTPFELATGLKPHLSEMRVQPGRLVGCRRLSGHSTLLGIGSEFEVPTHIHATPELVHVEPSMNSSLRHAYRHSIRGALNNAVFLDGVLCLKSAAEFQSAQLLNGMHVEIVRLITPERGGCGFSFSAEVEHRR